MRHRAAATTSGLMKTLESQDQDSKRIPVNKKPCCYSFSGKLNPHIPHLDNGAQYAHAKGSMNRLLDACHQKAQKEKSELVQTSLFHVPMIYIDSPAVVWQLFENRACLLNGESGGIQDKCIGPGTPISLPSGSKDDLRTPFKKLVDGISYVTSFVAVPAGKLVQPLAAPVMKSAEPYLAPAAAKVKPYWQWLTQKEKPSILATHDHGRKRTHIVQKVFAPIKLLEQQMEEIRKPYLQEIKMAAEQKTEVDMEDLTYRMALTMISTSQLGFTDFTEEEKTKLWHILHEIMVLIPTIKNIALISMEDALKNIFVYRLNLTRELTALINKAEKIIENLIERNKKNLLDKLNKEIREKNEEIQKENKERKEEEKEPLEKEFTEADLKSQDLMSYVKLFMAGGSETTSKLLLHSFLEASNPANQKFMDEIRNETNPERLDRLMLAFALEILRLYPPFSTMRFSVSEEFMLAQGLKMPADRAAFQKKRIPERKQEYDSNLRSCDRDDDAVAPSGTLLTYSAYHLHRHESAYGKDAAVFNPDRWLDGSINLEEFLDQNKLFNNPFFLTLGNGFRPCPGRKFSVAEQAKVLLPVLKNFVCESMMKLPVPLDIGFTLELAQGVHPAMRFHPLKPVVLAATPDAAQQSRLS